MSASLLCSGYLGGLCCSPYRGVFVLLQMYAFIRCFGIHWYGKKRNITSCMAFFPQNLQEKEIPGGEQMWISTHRPSESWICLYRAPRIFSLLPPCRCNNSTLPQASHAQLPHPNEPSLILCQITQRIQCYKQVLSSLHPVNITGPLGTATGV